MSRRHREPGRPVNAGAEGVQLQVGDFVEFVRREWASTVKVQLAPVQVELLHSSALGNQLIWAGKTAENPGVSP